MRGTQARRNVVLVQGEDPDGCVPCLEEGCDKHVGSPSDCLRNLPAARVVEALERALAGPQSWAHITVAS
jgi:heptosyltransferase-3